MSSAPQTSLDSPSRGIPGSPCDAAAAKANVNRTYLQEEASAAIPFGSLLKLGTVNAGDNGISGAKLPTAKTDKPIGFLLHAIAYNYGTELTELGVLPKTHIALCEKGALWIMPFEDMVPGDLVHWQVISHTGKLPGQITKTDDGVDSIDISKFAQVRMPGGPTSGQPIKLVFDFTNAALAATDS